MAIGMGKTKAVAVQALPQGWLSRAWRWLLAPLLGMQTHGQAYRAEIDGLRAVAVVAVLVNHLNDRLLPGGFLGVDIFFVISGYVVTSSLLVRKERGAWSFLRGFYSRRFKRLLPALIGMILVSAGLFVLVASPFEDGYQPSLRTGLASLFGFSNVYLLRQGNGYFSQNNMYNPFMHTWSLGVEEQFYFVWPFLVLVCGLGAGGSDRRRLRSLTILTMSLLVISWSYRQFLFGHGQPDQAFYLMPARFWELALGCLAYVLHRGSGGARDSGAMLPFQSVRGGVAVVMAVVMVSVFLCPETWRQWTTLLIALLTAALLVVVRSVDWLGRWLSVRWVVRIGLLSYSLYLWHWPLIVLARWTIGLRVAAIIPLLVGIVIAALISFRVEIFYRFSQQNSLFQRRPLLAFPLLSLLASLMLFALQGPLKAKLYSGSRGGDETQTSNNKRIEGTTIDTATCFLDPTAPLIKDAQADRCRSSFLGGHPTLYFEGDSHAHALIPLGASLVKDKRYNVSFVTRGGCPAPYFEPWSTDAYRSERYSSCGLHFRSRVRALLHRLKPGDRLVLVSSLPNYFGLKENLRTPLIAEAYQQSLLDLADTAASRGARIILFLPLPSFQQAQITLPLSLCQVEWFRPAWALPGDCRQVVVRRGESIAQANLIRGVQKQAASRSKFIDLFDPFPSLCATKDLWCSNYYDKKLLFSDGSHLTAEGARKIHDRFAQFLNRTVTNNSLVNSTTITPVEVLSANSRSEHR